METATIKDKITTILPMPSLMLILICSVGILAFYLMVISPDKQKSIYLDAKTEKIHLDIEKQQVLQPIYRQFKDILEKSKITDTLKLTFPKTTKLNQEGTYTIQSRIEAIAVESNLKVEKIETDMSTLVDDSDHLKIDLSVTGDFYDFRTFLVMLGERLPSLEYIEKIEIQREQNSTRLWMDLKIRLLRI